ncbi:hypothetical protein PS1_038346 [Malus domestica]
MLSIQRGRWGLILGDEQLMNDERFLQGAVEAWARRWMIVDPRAVGLDLGRTMNEERFLDSSGTWMLESFGVSELQSFKSFLPNDFFWSPNE